MSIFYCDVWFVVGLLQRGVVRHLVTMLYLRVSNLDRQNKFDKSKISNYGRQYDEELKSMETLKATFQPICSRFHKIIVSRQLFFQYTSKIA